MAAGNTYKQCGCRGEDGTRLGQQCPKLRRGNGTWSTRHGRWYYQLELPPRADGARRAPLRRGGFDTQTDAEQELRQARELLAIAAPGDTETAIRIADAITKSVRETRQLPDPGRVRKAVGGGHDPAVRPPTVGEWLEEWLAAKKNLRPGHGTRLRQPHPAVLPAAHRLHQHRPAPGHRRRLGVRGHRRTQRGHHRRPHQRRPRPARGGQGPPPRRGRHPAADPRHAALGDQHLHETAPGHAARQRRLTRRAARRGPAQAAGLDRRTRPGLAERLRSPAHRRAGTRARRAGQPARHLDLHPPPVPGHGLDPGPDPGLPRRCRPAPPVRDVAADRLARAAPRRGLRAAPHRHRPARRRHLDPVADHPARLGHRPGRPEIGRRGTAGRPRRRHRRRHPRPPPAAAERKRRQPGTPGPTPGSSSPAPTAPRCTPPPSPTCSSRSPTSPACPPSGCTTCATAPPPCSSPPGTT